MPSQNFATVSTFGASEAPDTAPRGLLVPSWSDVGHRPVLKVRSGTYAGLTVHEVAERIDCSVVWVREQLLDGNAPQSPPRIGPRLTEATLARRRAAGVPEAILQKSLDEIALALGITVAALHGRVYRR